MVLRKSACNLFPVLVALFLSKVYVFDNTNNLLKILILLSISLFVQACLIHFFFASQVEKFSENLGNRDIPLRLKSLFGTNFAVVTILLSPFVLSALLVSFFWVIFEFNFDVDVFSISTFCLGMIVSPITNSAYNSHDQTEFSNVAVLGGTYFAFMLVGISGTPKWAELLSQSNIVSQNFWNFFLDEVLFIILFFTILNAKLTFIIHLCFNEKTGLIGLVPSIGGIFVLCIPIAIDSITGLV